jgi:predicted dinucleotide-binding enzyme
MKIGIIGAGNIGSALARYWVKLGHQVTVANSRGPDSLREVAAATSARAGTIEEAATGADVVVLSIPQKAVPTLPKALFASLGPDAIVIDSNNYYPSRDGRIDAIEAGQLDSEWVAAQIGRPVIKAFNNMVAASLAGKAMPGGAPGRLALSVAGDPPAAREQVLRMVDQIGFDPVDAGPLSESWRQQPGSPCYCRDYGAADMKAALAEADRAEIAAYRASADEIARPFFAAP